MSYDCFITGLTGSFFSSTYREESTVIGYLCLETSEEFYAIGNLIAYPDLNDAKEHIIYDGKYHYTFSLDIYANYNKIKYCGTTYKFVFNSVVFFCEGFDDTEVDVRWGRFSGGKLGTVTFNKVSSLKAITYSENIDIAVGCPLDSINLYNENLNDKLIENEEKFYIMPLGFVYRLKGGIDEDKHVAFKEGYSGEFGGYIQTGGLIQPVVYTEEEQVQLDRITLPVEKDVFNLIHYTTCFVRFCLKSSFYDVGAETDIILNASLVPDLYSSFGYVPIPQWVAPGHKLDLYPDSLYAGYSPTPCFEYQLAKAFANTNYLDTYTDDLDVLACERSGDNDQCHYKDLLSSIGLSYNSPVPTSRWDKDYVITPHNMCFITHVGHGMFGYPDIADVAGWIENPSRPLVYGIYNEDGSYI